MLCVHNGGMYMKKILYLAIVLPVAFSALTPQEVVDWFSKKCDDVEQTKSLILRDEKHGVVPKKILNREFFRDRRRINGVFYEISYSNARGSVIKFESFYSRKPAMLLLLKDIIDQYKSKLEFYRKYRPALANKKELIRLRANRKEKKQSLVDLMREGFESFYSDIELEKEFDAMFKRLEEQEDLVRMMTFDQGYENTPLRCFGHQGVAYTVEDCQKCIDGLTALYQKKQLEWAAPDDEIDESDESDE
jgi:hypothetical protein